MTTGTDDPYATPGSSLAPKHSGSRSGLVVLAAIGGALLIVGLIMVAALTTESHPVYDEDRQVLVTAADLAVYVEGLEPVPAVEVITKERYLDGAWEISYEYDHPQGEPVVYTTCSVMLDAKREDAATTYMSMKVGLGIGLQLAEGDAVRQKERNDLFAWGDQSHNALLMRGSDPVGNAFVARKDTRVFMLVTAGVYFDTADALEELLRPKLEALDRYQPRE